MNKTEFRKRLTAGTLLMDGAMGTAIHDQGIDIDVCFETTNVEQPTIVAEIHRSYIEAGSDIIETNSFGANSFKLARHGLENEVTAINQAAVTIARRVIMASFKPVLLAGSVGPLGIRLAPLGRVSNREAQHAFAEQIRALVAAPSGLLEANGADLLIIETLSDLKEMEAAVAAARFEAPGLPLVTMLTFTRDDRTILGDLPASAATRLAELDVDAIGVNCSGGPAQILRIMHLMKKAVPNIPIVVMPNAGFPEQSQGGRLLYTTTPDYFGKYAHAFRQAGASLIGGCCGTTAAHIAAMRQALDSPPPDDIILPKTVKSTPAQTQRLPDQPTQLAQMLAAGEFIVTVEMSPPRGAIPQRQIEAARMLQEAGAHFIDMADNPLARMRMSGWGAAYLLQQQTGMETILHFPTRGRSLLRIHGDLLAAHALGVRNLFIVMGDPTHIGDFPEAMDNFDIVSSGLIYLVKQQLNAGIYQGGQSLDQPTSFVAGCAVNLNPKKPYHEMKLLRKKIVNGADFALTQPVFDPAAARQFLEDYEKKFGIEAPLLPIIAGIKPLYNSKNAEFLHHEVPGMTIPQNIRQRIKTAKNSQQEGIQIGLELVSEIRDLVQGVYVMPAFGRFDLAADLIDGLDKEGANAGKKS